MLDQVSFIGGCYAIPGFGLYVKFLAYAKAIRLLTPLNIFRRGFCSLFDGYQIEAIQFHFYALGHALN